MGTWGIRIAVGLLALGSGCAHFTSRDTVVEVPLEVQAVHALPQAVKNRVHVILVAGLLEPISLKAVRTELIELGFIKTSFGVTGSKAHFETLLADIRRKEPDARFVLVGQGGGSILASELANELQAQGAIVDALLFLEPVGNPEPFDGRVVCLSASGKVLYGADNLRLEAHPNETASHASTKLLLLQELIDSASRVQVVSVAPLAPASPVGPNQPSVPPTLPAPRPAAPPANPANDEWNFLRPDSTPSSIPTDKPILEAGLKKTT
jgi:hypothetical protein